MTVQASGENFIGKLLGSTGILQPAENTKTEEAQKTNKSAWLEEERNITNKDVSIFNAAKPAAYMG